MCRNLNEAFEKHQAINKKNTLGLEEQIEKLTKELNSFKKKSISDLNLKSEEVVRLGFRVEELTNTIETLKTDITVKDSRIKELSTNQALDQARNQIKELENIKYNLQEELSGVVKLASFLIFPYKISLENSI